MRIFLVLLFLSFTLLCSAQVLTINVAKPKFGVDQNKALIVSQINNIDNYSNTSDYEEVILVLDSNEYHFTTIPNSINYQQSYLVTDKTNSKDYTLYFTELPIIAIQANTDIVSDPKVAADFTYTDQQQTIISKIGIELRGGFSQTFPKKTYDLVFLEDDLQDNKDVQFGTMRSDDDWILDALYNEPLRIRSYVANKLWLEMHTLTYIEDEPDAKSGADVMFVEMFLNGQYNGLYNLSEQVDRKQLKLKKFNDNIRGELYKGISWGEGTLFSGLPDYDNTKRSWGGYDFKYPKEEDATDWKNLYDFKDFVINAPTADFKEDIWTKFDKENYIDYFLFLNLLRAADNTGKNIYVAKYKADEPYFYVPWDLDACFGTNWRGINEDTFSGILKNGFIRRVIETDPMNISDDIVDQWFDLRNDIFSKDYLSNLIADQYDYLRSHKLYEREAIVYPNYPFSNSDLSYTLSWLDRRLEYLDDYFLNTVSVDKNLASIHTQPLYPNPALDLVYIQSSQETIGKKYFIYNQLGQLITTDIISKESISVSHLQSGFYFIAIDNHLHKLFKK